MKRGLHADYIVTAIRPSVAIRAKIQRNPSPSVHPGRPIRPRRSIGAEDGWPGTRDSLDDTTWRAD